MSVMSVYRVARDSSGFPIGPYAGVRLEDSESELFRPMWDAHNMDRKHPTPFRDSGWTYDMEPDDVCAFSSLDSLYRWFDGYLDDLDSAGFRIWEYKTDSAFAHEFPCQTVVSRYALDYVTDYPLM